SRAANAEEKVARLRRRKEPRPLHAEGLPSRDFFWEIVFGELDVRLRTADQWSGRSALTGLSSTHAFVVVGFKSGLAIWTGQKGIRYGSSISAKELRPGDEGDISIGKLSAEPIKYRDDMSGLTRIISKERSGLIGKRPNHGDLADSRL